MLDNIHSLSSMASTLAFHAHILLAYTRLAHKLNRQHQGSSHTSLPQRNHSLSPSGALSQHRTPCAERSRVSHACKGQHSRPYQSSIPIFLHSMHAHSYHQPGGALVPYRVIARNQKIATSADYGNSGCSLKAGPNVQVGLSGCVPCDRLKSW